MSPLTAAVASHGVPVNWKVTYPARGPFSDRYVPATSLPPGLSCRTKAPLSKSTYLDVIV